MEVANLVKSYKENVVIKGISFNVEEGEIFALLGANRAGKTTTLECIERIRPYDSGTIEIKSSYTYNSERGICAFLQSRYLVLEFVDYFGTYIQVLRKM